MRTLIVPSAALLIAVSAGAQSEEGAYTRAVEFVPSLTAGGIGVAAVLGASEPWTMLRVLSSPTDSLAPALFLLPASSSRFASALKLVANRGTPRDSTLDYVAATDELVTDKRMTLSAIRVERHNETRIIFRLAAGDVGRTEAALELSLDGTARLAAALERAATRPVPPEPLTLRWLVLDNSDHETVHIDTVSLRRTSSSEVEAWVRIHIHDSTQDQVMTAFMEFRCADRRYAMTSISTEDRLSERTSNTPGASDSTQKWRPLRPESTAERIATRACRIARSR